MNRNGDVDGELADVGEPRRVALWIAVPVAIVLGALVLVLATRSGDDNSPSGRLVGQLAPLTEGVTTTGDTYDLQSHEGEWVVVNFFSTTCVPCVREHPELVEFSEAHSEAGDASVVSIAYADREENLVSFFEENGGDWPVVVGGADRLSVEYGVVKVPESFVVAPNGVVVAKITGGVTRADLDGVIERAQQP